MASSPSQGLNCISHLPCKLVSHDLDSSLANLVGSTCDALTPRTTYIYTVCVSRWYVKVEEVPLTALLLLLLCFSPR